MLEFERASCTRIVSIENKANYRAYLRSERREGELVLYLGGFASPGQRIYRTKLERLLEQERYRWAWPLVRALLERGGTLEQEATLV